MVQDRVSRKWLSRAFDGLLSLSAFITALLILFLMLSITYEVVMRYFFGNPPIWVFDISGFCLFALTFLGAAWVLRREGHTNVEILLNILSPRKQALFHCVTSLLALFVCAVVCVQGTMDAYDAYQGGDLLWLAITVPKHVLLWFIPFGFFTLCLQFGRRGWRFLCTYRNLLHEDASG